jgi:hypothetical protein
MERRQFLRNGLIIGVAGLVLVVGIVPLSAQEPIKFTATKQAVIDKFVEEFRYRLCVLDEWYHKRHPGYICVRYSESYLNHKKFREIQKKAKRGNPGDCYNLGYLYKTGYGVDIDEYKAINEIEAVKWFRKAAEKGNVSGMYELGLCYQGGVGVDADRNEAIFWLQRVHKAPHGYLILLQNVEVIKFLISQGIIDVNAKDGKGDALIHYLGKSTELHNLLASQGAIIIISDTFVDEKMIALAHFLVANGANVNMKNHDGKTPLDLAMEGKKTAVIEYLESIGAQSGDQAP